GQVAIPYRVQDYADAQQLHAGYLSTVIKMKTGKTIQSWIAEKTTTVAKLMLQHAEFPIKEISYRLGFSETAHFSNHFKRHTGMSPSVYRKNQRDGEHI